MGEKWRESKRETVKEKEIGREREIERERERDIWRNLGGE